MPLLVTKTSRLTRPSAIRNFRLGARKRSTPPWLERPLAGTCMERRAWELTTRSGKRSTRPTSMGSECDLCDYWIDSSSHWNGRAIFRKYHVPVRLLGIEPL